MVRFIFVCMGVVALSIVTMAAQYMVDGINTAEQLVAARNDRAQGETVAALAPVPAAADTTSPDALNNIETAAGAQTGNDNFGSGFTDVAPDALADDPAPASPIAAPQATAPAAD